MFDAKTYKPAGPVLKRFHESSKFFRVIGGPVGSGKTAGAGCAEMVLGAMVQNPMSDGVRRAKFGVLRDSYRNLYSQFIPSWFEWYPRELGHFVGSDDRPAMHEFRVDTPLGPCEVGVEMRALGTNSVEATCRGWNITGCFLDEVDLMPEDALSFLSGRVKRFPQRPFRVSKGVWGVFNKPDVDHWLYRRCMEEASDDFEFFDQPSGLLPGSLVTNPAAENLERLDDDYYQVQAKENPTWYVNRMVRNQWGSSVAGDVVYGDFVPERHISSVELEPDPRDELTLGVDGGGTPAAVIGGRDRYGRRVIYAEVVLGDPGDKNGKRLLTGVGPKRFADAVRDALHPRFKSNIIRVAYADPSMFYGADREMGEYADIETIGQRLKIPVTPAPSNEIALRLEAVRELMGSSSADGSPNLIINPSCRWLRRGFVADYKYEQRDPKQEGKRLKPQKTATSHVHDALQYFCLGDIGRAGVTAGPKFDRRNQKETYGGETSGFREGVFVGRQGAHVGGEQTGPSYNSDFDLWNF